MLKLLKKIENHAFRTYGLEHQKTLVVCRITEKIKKIFKIPLDK